MSAEGWLGFMAYAPGILFTWAMAFLLLAGCGILVQRIAAVEYRGLSGIFASFWLGLGLALGLLQILHLFLPVDGRTTFLLSLLGATGLILGRDRVQISLAGVPRWRLGWALTALALGVWLANRATGRVGPFDAGLYHLSALRWISEYPIVPGLGNLHGRLAFNNAYFLYLASLAVGPWKGMASNIGPGLLLWVSGSHSLFHLWRLFGAGDARLSDAFFGIFIIPIVRLGFQYGSSPSPDPAVFVLGYVLAWALLRVLKDTEDTSARTADGFLVVLLCAVGTIMKPSFAPLAMTAAVLTATALPGYDRLRALARESRRQVLWLGAFVALMLGTWAVRSVVLSGYPFYPLAAMRFPVPWAVPQERVIEEAEWITSWARAPGLSREEVLGNWDWLWPWIHGVMSVENRRFDVPFPLGVATVGLILWLSVRRSAAPALRLPKLILVPPAVGGLAWFLWAPDPRLAGASLWWLGAAAMSQALPLGANTNRWIGRGACLAICLALLGTHWTEEKFVNPGPAGGFHPVSQVELSTFRTVSGLVVLVPEVGNRCFDAPLPCTPNPDLQLRLLAPGNLAGGFEIGPAGPPQEERPP